MKAGTKTLGVFLATMTLMGSQKVQASEPVSRFCQTQIIVERVNWRRAGKAVRVDDRFALLVAAAGRTDDLLTEADRYFLRMYLDGDVSPHDMQRRLSPKLQSASEAASPKDEPVLVWGGFSRHADKGGPTHVNFLVWAGTDKNPVGRLEIPLSAYARSQTAVGLVMKHEFARRISAKLGLSEGTVAQSEDDYVRNHAGIDESCFAGEAPSTAQSEDDAGAHDVQYEVLPPNPGKAADVAK